MNDKKSKRFRRLAEARTVGRPQVKYSPEGTPPSMIPVRDFMGNIVRWNVKRGTGVPRKLDDSCTRAVTQQLKKSC